MRYVFFVILTVFSLGLPFITIDGVHLFLLSFDHMRLELLGISFDMQEFYLMPFLLMLLFIFIFAQTAVGGRVWCGWACPQTIFRVIYRDWIKGVLLGMNRRKNKQKDKKMGAGEKRVKNLIAFLLWVVIAFVAAIDFTWYFVPPEDFFQYIQNPSEHMVLVTIILVIAGFLIYDIIKLKEDFCSYVCPYVRIQSVLYDDDTVYTIYDEKRGGKIYDEQSHEKLDERNECTGCEACVTVCPTHIDIRQGLQLECINCLECADACTPVMAKLGLPSLIEWRSKNYFTKGKLSLVRMKTIAYAVLLVGITIALFIMGSTKENMLLNINKSNRVYKIDEGKVSNDYQFLFTNTQHEAHTFFFEVEGRDDIVIERPTKPFKINPGMKSKKIVVLSTTEKIGKDNDVTTKIPVIIKAYALDDKQNIIVKRKTIFAYPPLKEVQ
jgi:cytochrome c oxidase accessory protein FixG